MKVSLPNFNCLFYYYVTACPPPPPQVLRIRHLEIRSLKSIAYYSAGMTFLWTCAPVVIALASFATFVLSSPDNVLDANTAFVSLTLFNILRVPMNLLPILLVYLVSSVKLRNCSYIWLVSHRRLARTQTSH